MAESVIRVVSKNATSFSCAFVSAFCVGVFRLGLEESGLGRPEMPELVVAVELAK
jgi:hypothetical protein